MSQELISIKDAFIEFVKKNGKGLNMKLGSGGLTDVKGKSDVDIILVVDNYDETDKRFSDAKIEKDKDGKWVTYDYDDFMGREINIFATTSKDLANRSLTHRYNEIMLNKFTLLLAQAIVLKLNGHSTEEAWAKVLKLKGDPYEAMLMNKEELKKIAIQVNDDLKKKIERVPK